MSCSAYGRMTSARRRASRQASSGTSDTSTTTDSYPAPCCSRLQQDDCSRSVTGRLKRYQQRLLKSTMGSDRGRPLQQRERGAVDGAPKTGRGRSPIVANCDRHRLAGDLPRLPHFLVTGIEDQVRNASLSRRPANCARISSSFLLIQESCGRTAPRYLGNRFDLPRRHALHIHLRQRPRPAPALLVDAHCTHRIS